MNDLHNELTTRADERAPDTSSQFEYRKGDRVVASADSWRELVHACVRALIAGPDAWPARELLRATDYEFAYAEDDDLYVNGRRIEFGDAAEYREWFVNAGHSPEDVDRQIRDDITFDEATRTRLVTDVTAQLHRLALSDEEVRALFTSRLGSSNANASRQDREDDRPSPYPDDWPPIFNASHAPCDMLRGPCVCGAWHRGDDQAKKAVAMLLERIA